MASPVLERPTLRLSDATSATRIVGGRVQTGKVTLFSLFRDEMFFAPAFFEHYRTIGVEQFLILDDGSTDGTRAFLLAQPDCITLVSDLGYGQPIVFVDDAGQRTNQRAGVFFKMAVPPGYLCGQYVTYVDADEFLFLPPGVERLGDAIARLEARGDACCVASIVEFFPETVAGLRAGPAPRSFADLLSACRFFQPEPVVDIDDAGAPRPRNPSKSTRLFRRHGLRVSKRGLRRKLVGLFAPEYRKSPQFKTPVFRCDATTFLAGTHVCNRPAPRDLMLTIAHFVFTSQFEAKVGRALDWRSHVNGSDKYEHYARLMQKLASGDGVLTDAASTQFTSVEQFLRADLMRW